MAKAEKEFAVVGKRVNRVEGYEKVTGGALYVADIQLPGTLCGRILRSPYPHAKILRLDTSKAEKLRGVRAVVTAEDTIKRGWGAFFPDQYPLSVGKARYVGEEVAAVAAIDLDIAEEALELIEVEWEELPGVFDAEEAMKEGAPLLHDDKPRNIALTIDIERGDVEKAFKESDLIVDDTFESTPQWHCAIETIGSVAEYAASGKYTIHMNTQTLFNARYRIAAALGVRETDVRIIQPAVGGGFGGKSCDDNNAVVAAILAKKARKPVKIINTREEEFLAGCRPRVNMKIHVKMGFKKNGLIRAKQIRVVADNGAYCGKAPAITSVAALRHDTCYKYADVKTQAYLVYTNKIPTGAFRGFGNPSAEWAVEQAIDKAAHDLGIDPLEIARMNAAEAGYVSPHGNHVKSCELKQCIDKATGMIGWREKRANRKPNRGLGIGCSMHVNGRRSFGDWDGSSAMVRINEDGRATVITGEGEIGQGNLTVLRQIAAEELSLPYEDVDITRPDTDVQPHALGALASRLTYVAGNAVKNAAAAAARQLLEAAAEQLKLPATELTIINGQIGPRNGPETGFKPVAAVVRANIYKRGGQPIIGVGTFDNPSDFPDHSRYGNESGAYNFAVNVAEVEVDPATGQVTLLEIATTVDCGTVIHPAAAEGQVQGAVTQGIGLAMIEYFDWYNGTPTDPQLKDYPIPSAAMMPKLHVAFADSYEPSGPYGAKGLGEIGLDAVPAAIANAIADAVGVRITELPITAEKIHRALHPELYAQEKSAPPAPPKGGVWTRLTAGKPSGARPVNAELVFANSVEDAVSQLAAGEAALVAGGMSHAVRRERTGYPQAKRLIAITRIPELNELSIDARGVLRAGAAVRQQAFYDDERIKKSWRAIDDAMEAVGHTRIRRMLSVGGSVGPLIGGFDLPLALLALKARVTVAGPKGRRTVTLEEAFKNRFAKDEMVVSVEVDPLPARTGSSFYKYMVRGVLEIPTVNTAAAVSLNADGTCGSARVVVGAVSWKPIILDLKQLVGKRLSDGMLRDAVQGVRTLAEPMSDVRGSASYKREMAVEFAYRALATALQRAGAKP